MNKINDIKFKTKNHWYNNSLNIINRIIDYDTVQPHWHNYFELELFLTDGECTINDKIYPITKNSLVFVTPTDFHSYRFYTDRTYRYNMAFDYSVLESPPLLELLFRTRGSVISLPPQEALFITSIWNKLGREFNKTHSLNITRCIIMLELILSEVFLYGTNLFEEDSDGYPVPVLKSLRFIQQHFREPISITDAADSIYLSPNYFSRMFHKHVGMTFVQYLSKTRLKYAANLLIHTSNPIHEIADDSGFNNMSHFQKMFHKQYLLTPSEYRRKNFQIIQELRL